MNKAIFLDRDGVINNIIVNKGLPSSPSKFEEFKILPGVRESISKLKKLNFYCILVTNQPDVSRGKIKKEIVDKMNEYIKKELDLNDVFVCFHDDEDNCKCRKPKPGLILDATKKWNINLKKSYMIGDRWKDIDAGTKSGCKTIFIDNKYNESIKSKPNFVSKDLLNAVKIIEQNEKY
jgi:D-glycero-D-manno-heptose 1,7-bisphosphate phosphatase